MFRESVGSRNVRTGVLDVCEVALRKLKSGSSAGSHPPQAASEGCRSRNVVQGALKGRSAGVVHRLGHIQKKQRRPDLLGIHEIPAKGGHRRRVGAGRFQKAATDRLQADGKKPRDDCDDSAGKNECGRREWRPVRLMGWTHTLF